MTNVSAHSDTAPIPIDRQQFRYWLRQTVRNEKIHSRDRTSELTAKRALRMLWPNLNNPVFIIGAPRSGTTFLGKCLSVLPEISYHFEPVLTKAAVRYIVDGLWTESRARWIYRFTYSLLMRMSKETDLRFCEKTPGNCFIIPFLHRSFSGAKFIHIVRDGRDAAQSLTKKPWYSNASADSGLRDPDGYLIGPSRRFWVPPERVAEYESTNDLHRCIWLWRSYVEAAVAGTASIPQQDCLQVGYEDLLTNPANNAEQIAEFLNIGDAHSRSLFRNTITSAASTDSIGNWRREFDDTAITQSMDEAGELLASFGYRD